MPYGATPDEVSKAAAEARGKPLTFFRLREVNVERCATWHKGFPDDGVWLGVDWANAALGEMGEAANAVKKVRRWDTDTRGALDPDHDILLINLANEIADTLIYLDLVGAFFRLPPRRGSLDDRFGLPKEGWTGSHWSSYAGEAIGRVCSIALYLDTDLPEPPLLQELDMELHRVFVRLGRLADLYGINLSAAVVDKFNFISEREGLPHRL